MIKFQKYHGLGNDFIIFRETDLVEIPKKKYSDLAKKICNRHIGIGADGMMILIKKENSCQMIFYNCDGSIASMCGNGIRCFAHYIHNNNILNGNTYNVETLSGILTLDVHPNEIFSVRVNMGKPDFDTKSIPMSVNKDKFINEIIQIENHNYEVSSVFMGVAHSVIFTDDLDNIDIHRLGAAVENHKYFPQKTNVNFVQVLNKGEIKLETWERGAGHTLACGTGSCASALIGNIVGKLDSKVRVHLSLGDLLIEVNNVIYMTGPSELIAEGEYKYN